jgi:diguanylate cyclase (GGDEF)-like protein
MQADRQDLEADPDASAAGAAQEASAGHGTWRRMRAAAGRLAGVLGRADEQAFCLALDRTLCDMLPALGPLFGTAIIVFAAWDYWIAPELAPTTATLRSLLVLAGALGYVGWKQRIPVAWRCGLVYVTHTGAMIASSALLPGGLVLALPAISGAMFPLALVEPRLQRLLPVILLPMLLYTLAASLVLPQRVFAGSMLVYLAMLLLVTAMALIQGRWRRRAFLSERALAYAAQHDSLSGVLSRGYLIEQARHDVILAQRYGRSLAIGMADIDYFNRLNDSFGHPAGDALLCAVSRVCTAQLRASDYFGRIGGEEFVCVMPETTEEDALACAERMRAAVAALRIGTPGGTIGCTISIGIAALHPGHADFDSLLAAADAAMYRAKSKGRDRVELAPGSAFSYPGSA